MHILGRALRKRGVGQSRDFVTLNYYKRDDCRLDNSLKIVLDAVSNTEPLWRSFRAITVGGKMDFTNYSNHSVVDHA